MSKIHENAIMKICPRCYKETSGIHTCTPRYSNCCNADIYIVGNKTLFDPKDNKNFKVDLGKTYFYQCKKCNKDCDLVYGKVNDESNS